MMGLGKRQIVVELDGLLYRRQGDRLTQVPDLRDVEGGYLFISDLQGSIARSMIVEAEPRYVELLVARRLQEAGEFDEPVTVISHWKKKLGRNTTSILFTAVPTRIYLQYREQLRENDHGIALYPLSALLYQALKNVAAKRPVALLFQHGRFVDLILGNRRRIYLANRYVAYDASSEQLAALWQRIEGELKEAAAEYRIKVEEVRLINWIDAAQAPTWSSESGLASIRLKTEPLFFEETTYHLALFKSLRKLSLGASLSTPMERLMLLANRLALPFNLATLALAVLLAVGGIYHRHQKTALDAELQQRRTALTKMLASRPSPPSLHNYEAPLSFAKALSENQKTPDFGELLGDLSRAVGRGMLLEDVDVHYTAEGLTVAVTGRIEAPFKEAHDSYQRFLNLMQSRHYAVAEDQFDTQIRRSRFRIRLVRTL
jgi:nitroreductase